MIGSQLLRMLVIKPALLKGQIMYLEPAKKMDTETAPLLLTTPLKKTSRVINSLHSGGSENGLSDAEVAALFAEITEMVYGTGQTT